MKRSDFYIQVTAAVLFLAVLSYIGIYAYNALSNTFVTTPAVSYTIEETLTAEGFIIRTESALTGIHGSDAMPIVNEGERVANGQAIAVEYLTADALVTAGEIRSLRMMIAQLEQNRGHRTLELSQIGSVIELSQAVHSGDLSRLDEMSLNIETLVFETDSTDEADLDALRTRLHTLEQRDEGMRTFFAPFSGTFSHVVDGFEHIEPRALNNITPEGLEELFSLPLNTSGVGKLVTSFRWYFAAVMDSEEARHLQEGRQATLQFSGAFHSDKNMMVENISRSNNDGLSVVVFSSDRGLHEITHLRQLTAQIVYTSITGIRVPKEAIHLDDDGTTLFIFLQTGVRAERVNVEILREYDDVYLVRDGAVTGSPLRTGSTIIVRANNLYHGKVVG